MPFSDMRVRIGKAVLDINPGTGHVDGASLAEARKNMEKLVQDVGLDGVELQDDQCVRDGRFRFILRRDRQIVVVDMPGLALDQVRYLKQPGQDIWDYPRLYVDGSSWVWFYAVGIVRDRMTVNGSLTKDN